MPTIEELISSFMAGKEYDNYATGPARREALEEWIRGVLPAAPAISVVEPVTNPPAFDIDLPSGNADAPIFKPWWDAAVGDTLRVQITLATDTGFAAVVLEVTVVLDADDLTADVIEIAGLDTLDADDYIARARLERPDVGNSAWSATTASFEVPSDQWLPSDMFDPGAKWLWYDVQDLGTLWADASATTPAAVDGIVRRIDDKSGNGWNFIAASDALSPTLRQTGSYYYLETSSDTMVAAGAVGLFRNVGTGVIGVAARSAGSDNVAVFGVSRNGSATSMRANLNYITTGGSGYAAGGRRLDADSFQFVSQGETNTNDSAVVAYFDWADSALYLYVNGVLEASSTSFQTDGNTSDTDSDGVFLAGVNGTQNFWDDRVYEVVAGVPNTSDMTELSAYLAANNGF